MPILDTGKNLLSDAVIRLIGEVWQKQVYDIVNEDFVSKLSNKSLAIRILSQIIDAGHDVLPEGATQKRIIQGSNAEVEMTDEMVAAETKEWLKKLCLKIGYDEIPGSPHYYLRGNLYNFGIRLREICQAKPEALQSADVQWKVTSLGPLPTRAEVLAFLKPQLLKINNSLDYLAKQDNVVETMQYIDDVLTEVFYPEVGESKLPELILTIIGQYTEPKKKEEELEKCIRTFHMGLDIEAAGQAAEQIAKDKLLTPAKVSEARAEAEKTVAEKFPTLKELYLRLDALDNQLAKKGFGKKQLKEADEDLITINKLTKNPRTNPFKETGRLDEELTKAFAINTLDITERPSHLYIARTSFEASTALSSNAKLTAYKDSDAPSIAQLAEKIIFREAFLNKVLADEAAQAKPTDKAK
jgi:hypothetical protein